MDAARILLVEDSEAIRVPVQTALRAQGFAVESRPDGRDLEAALGTFAPDLVLLDVMLPGRDGFELLPLVRRGSRAAVVMLTARDTGRTGWPGSGRAPTTIWSSRSPWPSSSPASTRSCAGPARRAASTAVADLTLNDDITAVHRSSRVVDLTDTERRLLGYLAAHRERVVSKTQILTAVWGYEGFDENVVEVHVSSLRRKLEADGEPRLLHTVRGRGYRLGATP